jgi:hypothetical protein
MTPRPRRELDDSQRAALEAARNAQRKFIKADRARQLASDERLAKFRAARELAVSLDTLARELGLGKSHVQAILEGRGVERKRPR